MLRKLHGAHRTKKQVENLDGRLGFGFFFLFLFLFYIEGGAIQCFFLSLEMLRGVAFGFCFFLFFLRVTVCD